MRDDYADFSELERELELEMDGPRSDEWETAFEAGPDGGDAADFELGDDELADDMEISFEQESAGFDLEGDWGESRSQEFVERFMEISGRQFESPYEADAAMGEVLDDIEREYFFGAIKRGLKKLSKNKLIGSLAKKGLSMGVNKFLPGLQGALQLARGNVKGALLNFGKQALGSVIPGGGAVLDAVKAMGLQPGGGEMRERETWENYVNLSREAYEHLADNLTPRADQPAEAMRLANNAVQHAIAAAQARTGRVRGGRQSGGGSGRIVRLRVSPGETVRLTIVGA